MAGIRVSYRVSTVLTAVKYHRRLLSAVTREKVTEKPAIYTADELHYVSVPDSHWKLVLWRFIPPPQNSAALSLSAFIRSCDHPIYLSLYLHLDHFYLKGCEGKDPGLAGVVTLASSLDYSSSNSLLKLLLPLANPARALRVPAIPLRPLLAATYNPLTSRPMNTMMWLYRQISAHSMMEPEMLNKLVHTGFCSISTKLLLQLATAFQEGGLRDRNGKYRYKDDLYKTRVPILALTGNNDQICPPEAAHETVKVIPNELVTYKVFGESEGLKYAHYDLIGSRVAVEQVYPCVIQFLRRHD